MQGIAPLTAPTGAGGQPVVAACGRGGTVADRKTHHREKKSAMYAEGVRSLKRKGLSCAKRVHLSKNEMYTMYAMYTK
jgi:hypothetical protein